MVGLEESISRGTFRDETREGGTPADLVRHMSLSWRRESRVLLLLPSFSLRTAEKAKTQCDPRGDRTAHWSKPVEERLMNLSGFGIPNLGVGMEEAWAGCYTSNSGL